jgi:hypothetical protein
MKAAREGRGMSGWKLVPIEPTVAMLNALSDAIADEVSDARKWAAILAAAPTPPARTPAEQNFQRQERGEGMNDKQMCPTCRGTGCDPMDDDDWDCPTCKGTGWVRVGTPPEKMNDCYDCNRLYGDEHGFPDLVVPSFAWKRISPTGDDGGLLCPSCICKRLHNAGIRCEAAFMSGPIMSVSSMDMDLLRRIENIELAIGVGK